MPGKTTSKATSKAATKKKVTKSSTKSAAADGAGTNSGPPEVVDVLIAEYGKLEGVEQSDSLDLILFSHLALQMPLMEACRSYQRFKTQFVDWNEVRISSAKEVQEVVRAASEPLELALFLKEFLNRLFTEHHHVGLEFLRELSLSEIRSFFKRSPGFGESTVHLLLVKLKDYPVLPLEPWMLPCVERLGWADPATTPLQKQKDLFERVPVEQLETVHYYVAELARQTCAMDEAELNCAECVVRTLCPTGSKKTKRSSKKTSTKKVAKKATRKRSK